MNPINLGGGSTLYDERNKRINWFSLSTMGGVGSASMADVPHMVSVNSCSTAPGTSNPYTSTISGEVASAGYYKVHLVDSNVDVELAAAVHSGISRLTFPSSTDSCVVFDPLIFGGTTGTITVDPANNQVFGSSSHNDFSGHPHTTYYAATFDTPFSASGTWSDGQGFVKFITTSQHTVMMKVAISYVSVAGAQMNLSTEIPTWDFNAVKTSADSAWNTLLNSIEYISGATVDRLRMFYTALYRSCQDPKVFSDTDGRYLGIDGQIHTVDSGHTFYAGFSGWDVYRTQPQLLAILSPGVASDIVRSYVLTGQQRGGRMPKWTWGNQELDCMIGGPSCAYIGSAYAFGATDIDLAATKDALIQYGMDPTLTWTSLRSHIEGSNVSSQAEEMESCNADMGVAAICLGANDQFHYSYFRNRAQNIFKTWDPARIDSFGYAGHFKGAGRETTIEQQVWCSPVNYGALIGLMGGISNATARLDTHTSQLIPYNSSVYYNPVNEPGIHTPYVYNWLRAPWKTQALVRQIMTASYVNAPVWLGGLPQISPAPSGWTPNDDTGTLSAWYAYLTMGLYPAVPGVGGFTVTSPLFSYKIHLKNGADINVTANNASIQNKYIQSLSINGVPSSSLWIPWASLTTGANLVFNLGSTANTTWGNGTADAPPSFRAVVAETNYALAATISASSESGTSLAKNAADSVTSTKWLSAASNSGDKWLRLDLGTTVSIDHWIVMHGGQAGERVTTNTKDFKLQKSADGSVWADVDVVTGNTANITDRAVTPFDARYVRLYITTPTQTTDTAARIYEFQVFGKSALAVVASSEFNASQAARMAVDDSTSTKWCSANSDTGAKWLEVDLGEVRSIGSWVVKHAGAGGESAAMNTKAFKLQKSVDQANWIDVDSVTNNTANVTDRTVSPFTTRYVRLYITAPTQGTDVHARIYEFQLFE